jgi:hypothetical protein
LEILVGFFLNLCFGVFLSERFVSIEKKKNEAAPMCKTLYRKNFDLNSGSRGGVLGPFIKFSIKK